MKTDKIDRTESLYTISTKNNTFGGRDKTKEKGVWIRVVNCGTLTRKYTGETNGR